MKFLLQDEFQLTQSLEKTGLEWMGAVALKARKLSSM